MTALMHGTGGINGVRSIATVETWKFISHSKAAQKAKELNVTMRMHDKIVFTHE